MALGDEEVQPLRQALQCSPDNAVLRLHLAGVLMKYMRYQEAEQDYRGVLQRDPTNADAKIGLATAFFRNGKLKESQVLIESLLAEERKAPAARVLYARLLVQSGDVPKAVSEYHRAIGADADVADPELEDLLGIYGNDESQVVEGRMRAAALDEPDVVPVGFERPSIGFDDVGGMQEVKDAIAMKILYPMQKPELFEAYGKEIGGGILLYGPPGCGKTYLARATAGEVQARFISVGISDILDMWIGASERNLHELFEQARAHQPCVLFFDEVDALGASRSDFKQSSQRNVINQFLSELDGIDSPNHGVLVLAATNAPWHLDAAFRRPGRFDRILFVPPPDVQARVAILGVLLKGKPAEAVDLLSVAKKTEGFSGADLKAAVDQAIEAKLREALQKGAPTPLGTKDLLQAVRTTKPTTKEWFSTAKNYALYSNQGGLYDDILDFLKIRP